MTNEAIQFFLAVKDVCAVFGKGDSFILIPLGTGETADPAILVDGVERGFKLCGYVGLCRDCDGISTYTDSETPDGALTMILAVPRYAAHRTLRDRQIAQLEALHARTEGMTGFDVVWALWRKCLMDARQAGNVPAEAVQNLIASTRNVLTSYGCPKRDANQLLFDMYTRIHWDWPEPTDRVFETLLDFELTLFFAERSVPDANRRIC